MTNPPYVAFIDHGFIVKSRLQNTISQVHLVESCHFLMKWCPTPYFVLKIVKQIFIFDIFRPYFIMRYVLAEIVCFSV